MTESIEKEEKGLAQLQAIPLYMSARTCLSVGLAGEQTTHSSRCLFVFPQIECKFLSGVIKRDPVSGLPHTGPCVPGCGFSAEKLGTPVNDKVN